MQATSALLRWAVAQGQLLATQWEPPTDLSPFVGRSRSAKAVTTPLEVDHILALVRALPDPRWRLAFQLMAAYGLRPEELQHLQLRDGRLWCTYEKVASRGKTKPRALRLLPCDDWAVEWKLFSLCQFYRISGDRRLEGFAHSPDGRQMSHGRNKEGGRSP